MEKIAVVTDTGSNLSFEEAKELGIYLLPLQITIDETTYQDTLEISTQDIYNELANGKMPKTSMAAYQKIYDLFEELKKEYDTVFAIPLTNGLSTNASTMQSIARELEMNVHVIDMYATCALEKHIAIWIKKLVDENKSSEEILKIIQPAQLIDSCQKSSTFKTRWKINTYGCYTCGFIKDLSYLTYK